MPNKRDIIINPSLPIDQPTKFNMKLHENIMIWVQGFAKHDNTRAELIGDTVIFYLSFDAVLTEKNNNILLWTLPPVITPPENVTTKIDLKLSTGETVYTELLITSGGNVQFMYNNIIQPTVALVPVKEVITYSVI